MTILCEPDAGRAARITSLLVGPVQAVNTLADAAMALAAGATPTVVVGPGVALESAESFATQLRNERPDGVVVLLRKKVDDKLAARMRTAGITTVISEKDTAALSAAVSATPPAEPSEAGGRRGDVITVFSPKGGCGTTAIASNLAVSLTEAGTRSVCLVDLDLAFGDVAIALGLAPQYTIFDGVEAGGSISGQLGQLVTKYRSGLDCVLAPVGPADGEKVPASLVPELLATLSENYDSVIVDTPSQLSEHVLFALDASRFHVLVTTPDIAALKDMRLALDMFDVLSYRVEDRVLVLNGAGAKGAVPASDVATALGTAVAVTVPSSPDVSAALNSGVPLAVSHPKHDVSKAVQQLAGRLSGDTNSSSNRRPALRRRKRSA